MPKKKPIEFTESAVADLEALRDWYSEQGVPDVGARLITEIVDQAARLSAFPDSGRIVPEFGLPAVRELLHPPFRIVYRVGAGRIWIVRVWRSERLLKTPE